MVGANGCGLVGKGCVGQLCSPGTSDWGTGPFFHREDRFTGFAMEEKEKAHLGGLRDGWDVPTILVNGD